MRYFIIFFILLINYSYANSEELYYSSDEYETEQEYLKKRNEYLSQNPNANYCQLFKKQLNQTRHDLAIYSDMFNKKVTQCIQSLKNEKGFKCLQRDLEYFKSVRTCNITIQNNTKRGQDNSVEIEKHAKCLDEAKKSKKINKINECQGYVELAHSKNVKNPLSTKYSLSTIISSNFAPRISHVTKSQNLEAPSKIKKTFNKCFRQAWFDTRRHYYNNGTNLEKNRTCFTTFQISKCLFNKVRNRFRCRSNANWSHTLKVSEELKFVKEKNTEERVKKAVDSYGYWYTYADFQPWKPHYVELKTKTGKILNGGARYENVNDTNGKFVSAKYHIFLLNDDTLNYVPKVKNGYELSWSDSDQGQIEWAQIGDNLKTKLKKLYKIAKDRNISWEYIYNKSEDQIYIVFEEGRKALFNFPLKYIDKNGVTVLEIDADKVSSSNAKVSEQNDSKENGENEKKAKDKKSEEETKKKFSKTQNDIVPKDRESALTQIIKNNCNEGSRNNNLQYYRSAKDALLENLRLDMLKLKCTHSDNSGCNSPIVVSTITKFNKERNELSNKVSLWMSEGHTRRSRFCSNLYFPVSEDK